MVTNIDLDVEQGRRISQIANLGQLHTLIVGCRRCQVAGYLEVADPMAFTPIVRPIMLVGQSPGLRATAERVPFAGAGTNGKLKAWFAAAGIPPERDWREFMYISSVTKCYPGRLPGAAGDRVPTPTEQALCRPYLDAQLRLVRPRIIVMVGLLSIQTFLLPLGLKKSELTLSNVVGQGYTDVAGVRYLPLPHPSGVSRWLNSATARAQVDRACALLKQWREELQIG